MLIGESSFKSIKFHLAREEWDRVIEISLAAIAMSHNFAETNNLEVAEFYNYLARAYSQKGKLTEAIDSYQKIFDLVGERAEIYAELGLLHSRLKLSKQAIWYYSKALKLKPNWVEIQYNLAVVLHQVKDWSGAIAAYNRAIELKPDYAAVYYNLGVLYDQKGELEAATALYQQVIAIEPNLIQAYSNLSSVYVRQQQYEKAIAVFQQGIAIDPTSAVLHNNLGQVYWFNRQQGLAFESFETAIILNPNMVVAYHNLGRLWQEWGNAGRAIKCFKQAIEIEPNNVILHSSCADVYQKMGDIESTINCWRTIIKLEPDFIEAYCQTKSSAAPKDLLEIAKLSCSRFLEALKIEPKAEVYYHLWRTYSYMGDVLLEFGGIIQAKFYYQQALEIEPEAVELYLKLGNCLAKQEQLDAAIAIYNLGLLLEPEHSQICFQLGQVLERSKEAEEAIDYYETVLDRQKEQSSDCLEKPHLEEKQPRFGVKSTFSRYHTPDSSLGGKEKIWRIPPVSDIGLPFASSNAPKLFSTEENLSLLPTKIYHYTQDWVRDCQIPSFDYTQIAWHEALTLSQTKRQRYPENIGVTVPGKPLHPDCGGVNCNKCMRKQIAHFQPVQIGENAFKCSLEEAAPIRAGLPFVVTIPQGRIWVAPHKNSWMICNAIAVITPDNYLLGDLSRDYPWFLPECPYQERAEHSIYQQQIPLLEKIEGKVAFLSGLAGHVYYHWMFDILPRLEILKRSGIEFDKIDWFVINSFDKPYQKETLALLDVPVEKIIESDRHSHIQATELIVPSFPGYMDWVEEGTIKFLRQTFLTRITSSNTNSEKIYISRARAKNRQLINELEVSRLLDTKGFKTVFLEELSVLEQVAIFARAELIVAPHGSGLTNLVFCSPNTKIIELFSPNYVRTDYWMISQQLQLQHYYLVGKRFNCPSLSALMYQNPLTEDILVDISSLKLILHHLQS